MLGGNVANEMLQEKINTQMIRLNTKLNVTNGKMDKNKDVHF